MKNVSVCTGTYKYVPVHTEQWHGINSIYWYVLVHTSMYQYILVCTRINWIMNMSWMHKLVYTSTYEYIRVQSVLYAFKKSANRSRTRDLLHTSRRTYPCPTGVQTSTPDICCGVINVYIPCHCYLSQQCHSKKCKMSHVGHATFGSSTTNTLHTAESLGYMLLERPICELSVLEQWRALANAMQQRGLCEMWVVQAECTANAHGS
jgi:hypothetical protein